jgi:hypothetical protein
LLPLKQKRTSQVHQVLKLILSQDQRSAEDSAVAVPLKFSARQDHQVQDLLAKFLQTLHPSTLFLFSELMSEVQ